MGISYCDKQPVSIIAIWGRRKISILFMAALRQQKTLKD